MPRASRLRRRAACDPCGGRFFRRCRLAIISSSAKQRGVEQHHVGAAKPLPAGPASRRRRPARKPAGASRRRFRRRHWLPFVDPSPVRRLRDKAAPCRERRTVRPITPPGNAKGFSGRDRGVRVTTSAANTPKIGLASSAARVCAVAKTANGLRARARSGAPRSGRPRRRSGRRPRSGCRAERRDPVRAGLRVSGCNAGGPAAARADRVRR